MQLQYPLVNFTETQKFGENLNGIYSSEGLLGHSGIDLVTFHGDTVHASIEALVSCIRNKDNPDPMQYRFVHQIYEDINAGLCYELEYGHLDQILVSAGIVAPLGMTLGTEGNTGLVASNGIVVTREMKLAGSTAGSHVHFQIRLLKKIPKPSKIVSSLYSIDSFGSAFVNNGYVYEIQNQANGYTGAIDPAPFMVPATVTIPPTQKITQTLRYGSKGDQVALVQKVVHTSVVDGIFGINTEAAVKAFQEANGLVPDGVVGVKTAAVMNPLL